MNTQKKQKCIAGLGEVLWDIYPEGRYLGGALFNVVHHAVQLGHSGILISRIGDDPAGRELIKTLERKNIDTRFIQIDSKNPTGFVTVTLDCNKVPSFVCSPTVTCDFLEWDERFYDIIPEIDAVVFGTFAQRTSQSAHVTERFLRESRMDVKVFDVNFRGWNQQICDTLIRCLPLTDILKMNENELRWVRGIVSALPENIPDALKALAERYHIKLVCLTAGEYGCLLTDGGTVVYCPGIAAQPVDTTGAGDAFIAALTIKYLEGAAPAEMGDYANRAALYTITKMGAAPEYDEKDIFNYLNHSEITYIVFKEWEHYIIG